MVAPEHLDALIALLERIAADRRALDGVPPDLRQRLLRAVAAVYSPDRVARRRLSKAVAKQRHAARVQEDEQRRASAVIRARDRRPVAHSPNVFPPPAFTPDDRHIAAPAEDVPGLSRLSDARRTIEPQHCYICKQHYTQLHHFYDQLCPSCAAFNFTKRTEVADLRGRVAMVTGGRVKIGYHASLKLLRSGAHVLVTTRFPRDAANRYAREPDCDDWRDRLEIFGLDLRHTPSVDAFCQALLGTRERLDILVNNACQTVRRPPEFYAHMMAGERAALASMPAQVRRLLGSYRVSAPVSGSADSFHALAAGEPSVGFRDILGLAHAPELSQVPLVPEDREALSQLFPEGQLDADLQQIDLRDRNSWRLLLHEVSAIELLEVHLVNAIAPFLLNARLKPLMLRTPERDKHIVNVSAVEGQFYRRFKTTRHPHTNMAKAALNMMTRTSAADFHADGIHMNSVDTGWITDEDPAEVAARKAVEQRFAPPLDSIDGAARIVDPVIDGFNTGRHVWGQFLKDYHPTDW